MKVNSIFRTLAERLSRGKIIKRRLTIGGGNVPFFVTPDAQLKYLKIGENAFDKDLIRIAERMLGQDSIVWDIGANVGVFTFAASAIASAGTIVSVEPDIWLASLLRRSCKLKENREKDIRVLPVAISDTNGTATFLIANRGRASNALERAGGHSQMGGVREKQFVPTLTLDTMADSFPKPHFVKIDVEGAELFVLRGASRLFGEIRPVFYVEVGNNTSEGVMRLIKLNKYKAFDGKTGKGIDACSQNTFFIPEENRDAQLRVASGCM